MKCLRQSTTFLAILLVPRIATNNIGYAVNSYKGKDGLGILRSDIQMLGRSGNVVWQEAKAWLWNSSFLVWLRCIHHTNKSSPWRLNYK